MPTRAVETSVRDILDTTLDGPTILAFIQDANLWVTEELGSNDPPLSPDRLELIERYIACALCRIRDLGLVSSQLKDVKEQYQVDPKVSEYLLRAASFDPTGKVRHAFITSADPSIKDFPVRMRVGTPFARRHHHHDPDFCD